MPDYFKDTDPSKLPLSKHKLIQDHEWSGRKVNQHQINAMKWSLILEQNLYIASYVYSIDGMDTEQGTALINDLIEHVSKPKYRTTIVSIHRSSGRARN